MRKVAGFSQEIVKANLHYMQGGRARARKTISVKTFMRLAVFTLKVSIHEFFPGL